MHFDGWTLALQTVNIVVLVWLLARFLYRPLLALADQRQAGVRKLLDEAERTRLEVDQLNAQAAALVAANRTERERLATEARAAAQLQAAAEQAKAADEIRRLKDAATTAIEKQRIAAQEDLTDAARRLAIDIAKRLLTRIPPATVAAAFLTGLRDELRRLSPQMRASLNGKVELVSAEPLDADTFAGAQAALESAFEHPLALTGKVDRALIAGFELRAPHATIGNSWKADLDRIAKELNRESRQSSSPDGLAHDVQGDR
jgi:F-type H+-transporting ATPase subunit b